MTTVLTTEHIKYNVFNYLKLFVNNLICLNFSVTTTQLNDFKMTHYYSSFYNSNYTQCQVYVTKMFSKEVNKDSH